jgi:hypothetical protein
VKLGDYMDAVIADLKANASFLKDVGSHGKVFGAAELGQLVIKAPAVRIALVGARGTSTSQSPGLRRDIMGRADNGQFRGPLQMVAFLIEKDWVGDEARNRLVRLIDQFVTFLEHRRFGLPLNEAGPALITGFDIFYAAEIDAKGAAIGSVTWEQEVFFGRDIHREDLALLTGDKSGHYPPDQTFYPEGEWMDKGVLDPEVGPVVDGSVSPMFTGEPSPDTDDPEPMDI